MTYKLIQREPTPEPEKMTIDQSRDYLVKFMEQHFTDKTFHRYILGKRSDGDTNLAGDFAWQMARALRMIDTAPQVDGYKLPDVDALAQFIRSVDGNNTMGAGALAEKICEWLSAQSQPAEEVPSNQWLFVTALMLQKTEPGRVASKLTLHWNLTDSEENAIGRAVKFAADEFPEYSVASHLCHAIPEADIAKAALSQSAKEIKG